ncbi:MAG: T9SS type A sorting domain-containing protein [Chlorobi bacterium]|nr:T9SS type A sorting domain-containing protein [Chlorobiota bacterium]
MKKVFWILFFTGFSFLYAQKRIFQEPMPVKYRFFQLNDRVRAPELGRAPLRGSGLEGVALEFPVNNEGKTEVFRMYRTEYMEPGLAARFPELRTYAGQSASGKTLYLTVTPYESTLIVLRPGEDTYLIKQFDGDRWIGFNRTDQPDESQMRCETDTQEEGNTFESAARPVFEDGVMRKFRLALSITGELSGYHLNRLGISSTEPDSVKIAAVLGAVLQGVTRINSVYERDLAISLMLVDRNDRLIFLDPNSDPFDNYTRDMSGLLSANQNTVDNQIGNNRYDVAQVWCYGGLQGLARLRSVCNSTAKAMAAARGDYPEADRFLVKVASHEMGHQFGAYHVFYNSCGGNRTDNHAVEPGSGTSIMAYAGICPPNIQFQTDDRFNAISINDIWQFIYGQGTCAAIDQLTNRAPTLNAGPDRYIPKETPFVLTAHASDPDGDVLTYTWDEQDIPNHDYSTTPQPTWTSGPMFRPFPPRVDSLRYFPNLDSLLADRPELSTTWEVLPSVQRLLKFTVTVRDNNVEGGLIDRDNITLGVVDNAGPFRVTSQPSSEVWHAGETRTVTWDVAGTDGGNVNCQFVDIIYARDGRHFLDTLAALVPNTGSYTLTVPPAIHGVNGRLMVKARDNYFLSLAKGKITIGNYNQVCNVSYRSTPGIAIPDGNSAGITDTIYISPGQSITDVDVYVRINHSYVADLDISIISPSGHEVVLWSRNCGNRDNLDVIFDDEASPINCDSLQGVRVKPLNALGLYDASYHGGPWVLKVVDNLSPDSGTLEEWGLDFCLLQLDAPEQIFRGLKVYPVPAGDVLHIDLPESVRGDLKVRLFDLNGRLLIDEVYEGETGRINLPLQGLARGQYVLTLTSADQSHRQLIIKQ